MEPESRSSEQKVREHKVFVFFALLLVGMIACIIIARLFGFTWTGFLSWIGWTDFLSWCWTSLRTKSLWDWLQLLIVPIMLAIGVFWLNQRQKNREEKTTEQRIEIERKAAEKRAQTDRDIATDNQREKSLQDYIDKMSELLLKENLYKSDPEDVAREVARVRTLNMVSRLDGPRKGSVLQFLHEDGLIDKDKHIIDLHGADFGAINFSEAALSGVDLSGVDLHNADLRNAKLGGADLSETNLLNANLSGATLSEVDLHGANLSGANLSRVNLSRANLSGTMFCKADLHHSNLSGATLDGANLSGADLHHSNLSGATLDGANLSGADLLDADLSKATLSRVDLHKANLIGADLSEVYLDHVDLRGADLRRAYLGQVNLSRDTLNLDLDGANLLDPRVTKNETLLDVHAQSQHFHFWQEHYDPGEYTVAYIPHSKSVLIVQLVLIILFPITMLILSIFDIGTLWGYLLFSLLATPVFIAMIRFSYFDNVTILTNKRIINESGKIEYKNMHDIRAINRLQQWMENVPADSIRRYILSDISDALPRWLKMAQADINQWLWPMLPIFLQSARLHTLCIIRNVLLWWLEIGDLRIERSDGMPDFIISNIDHYLLLKNEIFRINDYDGKER